MVEVQGFEPRQTESKSVVLPLHYTSMDTSMARHLRFELRQKVLETFVLPLHQ